MLRPALVPKPAQDSLLSIACTAQHAQHSMLSTACAAQHTQHSLSKVHDTHHNKSKVAARLTWPHTVRMGQSLMLQMLCHQPTGSLMQARTCSNEQSSQFTAAHVLDCMPLQSKIRTPTSSTGASAQTYHIAFTSPASSIASKPYCHQSTAWCSLQQLGMGASVQPLSHGFAATSDSTLMSECDTWPSCCWHVLVECPPHCMYPMRNLMLPIHKVACISLQHCNALVALVLKCGLR